MEMATFDEGKKIREQFKSFVEEKKLKHAGFAIRERDIGEDGEEVPCFVIRVNEPGLLKRLFGNAKKEISALQEFENQISIPVVIDKIASSRFF